MHALTHSNMSDDEEYYEWDEEYFLEDLVPDLVVSARVSFDEPFGAISV